MCTHKNCLDEAILMETHNIRVVALLLTLIIPNCPCFEHLFMGPKVFEPLKFCCIMIWKVCKFTISRSMAGYTFQNWSTNVTRENSFWPAGYAKNALKHLNTNFR